MYHSIGIWSNIWIHDFISHQISWQSLRVIIDNKFSVSKTIDARLPSNWITLVVHGKTFKPWLWWKTCPTMLCWLAVFWDRCSMTADCVPGIWNILCHRCTCCFGNILSKVISRRERHLLVGQPHIIPTDVTIRLIVFRASGTYSAIDVYVAFEAFSAK